jgi:hypothetical protein
MAFPSFDGIAFLPFFAFTLNQRKDIMSTTNKLFVSCLFGIALILVSGCGGGNKVPTLTPAEQAEVDEYVKEGGRDAIADYLYYSDWQNDDEERVLKYVKYFVSQGANVNAVGCCSFNLGRFGTPLDAAKLFEKSALAKYLESVGGKSGEDL